MMKNISIVFLIHLFLLSSVFGDMIVMKDGDKVKGTILFQDKKIVKIKTLMGILSLKKLDIKRLLYSRKVERKTGKKLKVINIYMKDGRFYRGVLLKKEKDHLTIKTFKKKQKIMKKNIRLINSKQEIFFHEKKLYYPFWSTLGKSLVPGFAQFSMKKNAKGWIFMGVGGGLLLSTVISHFSYRNARTAYLDAYNTTGFNSELYETADSRRKMNNIFFYSFLSVMALNIADALIFREKPGKKPLIEISTGYRNPEQPFFVSIGLKF